MGNHNANVTTSKLLKCRPRENILIITVNNYYLVALCMLTRTNLYQRVNHAHIFKFQWQS